MAGVHPRQGTQGAEQLVTFPIFSTETDGKNFTDPQRDEVVENGARRPGLRANLDDIVNREAPFDGCLRARGINLEVAVETEVAEDGDPEPGIARGEFAQTLGSH